jgi:hypothetical protein
MTAQARLPVTLLPHACFAELANLGLVPAIMQSKQYVDARHSHGIEGSSKPLLADMPPEVLACVLRHLPVGMRLGPCALTCSAFSAAAVAVTDAIFMQEVDQPKADTLAA